MHARQQQSGFTLIELVLAVAIISLAFTSLLYLQLEASDRAFNYNQDRMIQRIAQEKLDEVIFELEGDTEGTVDEFPEWTWQVEATQVSNSGPEMLEATITVNYTDEFQGEKDYTLTTWFLAGEDHPLLDSTSSTGAPN